MKRTTTVAAFAAATLLLTSSAAFAQVDNLTFELAPNPAVLSCLSDGQGTPTATVTVIRGKFNDSLSIAAHHIKPGLAFDVFTVQRSNLNPAWGLDPAFTNFGMAWYQSDLQTGPLGNASVSIRTILLDQIFGFDPDVALPPTNTFHVGFWFNNPNDAAACGFNVLKPTPFNGEHKAGPVAMISVPNADTKLGPLCTNPNLSTTPASCNP